MNFLKKIMDLLINIKDFVAELVIHFLSILINLLLIIKYFVTKAFMNLLKILFELLIFIKHFVAKVVMNFVLISINLLLIIKHFVTKVVMNFIKMLLHLLIHLKVFVAKLSLNLVEITISLCSKVVINLLIMSPKMWKLWTLNKFLRLMAFLTLFYQIISVTISYSQFKTVIDTKVIFNLKHEPTITLCLKIALNFLKELKVFI
jgi:hypothetical protein